MNDSIIIIVRIIIILYYYTVRILQLFNFDDDININNMSYHFPLNVLEIILCSRAIIICENKPIGSVFSVLQSVLFNFILIFFPVTS